MDPNINRTVNNNSNSQFTHKTSKINLTYKKDKLKKTDRKEVTISSSASSSSRNSDASENQILILTEIMKHCFDHPTQIEKDAFSRIWYAFMKNTELRIIRYNNTPPQKEDVKIQKDKLEKIDRLIINRYNPNDLRFNKQIQDSNFYSTESRLYPKMPMVLLKDFRLKYEDFYSNNDFFKGYIECVKNDNNDEKGEYLCYKAIAVFSKENNSYDFLIDTSNFLEKELDLQILAMNEFHIVLYHNGSIEIINKHSWVRVYSIPFPEICKVECCLKDTICLMNFDEGKLVIQINFLTNQFLFAKTFLYMIDKNSKVINLEIFDLPITNKTNLKELFKKCQELKTGFHPATINIKMLDKDTLIADTHYLQKNLFIELEEKYIIPAIQLRENEPISINSKSYTCIEENSTKFLVEKGDLEKNKIPMHLRYHVKYKGTEKKEFNLSDIKKKKKIKIDNIEYSFDENYENLLSSDSKKFPIEKKYSFTLKNKYNINSIKFEQDQEILINGKQFEGKKYKREKKQERPNDLFIKDINSQELFPVINIPEKLFTAVVLLEKGELKNQINNARLSEPFHIINDHVCLISHLGISALNYRTKKEIYFNVPYAEHQEDFNWLFIHNFLIYYFENDFKQCCHIIDIENPNTKREIFFKEKIIRILPAENSKHIAVFWTAIAEPEANDKRKYINIFEGRNYYLVNLKTGKALEIEKTQFKISKIKYMDNKFSPSVPVPADKPPITHRQEAIFCNVPYIIQVGQTFGHNKETYLQELHINSFTYDHKLIEQDFE